MSKTTKILRWELFKPTIEMGQLKINSKVHLHLPEGAAILKVQPSASTGGLHLWTIGGNPEKLDKRYFMACRTGIDLPECIMDCTHLETISGVHFFEVPPHLLPAFQHVNTGF